MLNHTVSPILWIGIGVVALGGTVGFFMLQDSRKNETETTGNQEKSVQQAQSANPTSEPDIVLKNLGLANINSATVYTRFAVQDYASNGMKGFYVFGDALPGNRVNPNFEYASLKEDAEVISAIDGTVTFVREQPETNDYEVFIQPKDGSIWTVGYDHLVGVKVAQGNTVKAGDVLGTAAVQNNGLYRFELQINKDVAGVTTHYCPVSLLDPAVSEAAISDLTTVQNAWEAVKSQDLYNPATQNPVGCTKTTLSVTEAEGR